MQDDRTIKTQKLTSANDFFVGQLVEGRYKIVRELGRGGMAVVWEVENVFIKKTFAMKVIDTQNCAPAALQRFQREAKLLTSLEHPNLVKANDFGVIDDNIYYVLMEKVEGQSLSHYLKEHGRLSERATAELFLPIVQAIRYAHNEGVVHRDLKPSNIMMVKTHGSEYVAKILDFGIATYTEAATESLTRTGEVIGTPLYMSPEQVSGSAITSKSDIYALGCVMFETLTGAPPFVGRTALETMMMHSSQSAPTLREASLGNSFSKGLEITISRMLDKDPQNRPSSAEIVESLTNYFTNDQNIAHNAKHVDDQRKHPKGMVLLGCLAAISFVMSAGFLLYWQNLHSGISMQQQGAASKSAVSSPTMVDLKTQEPGKLEEQQKNTLQKVTT